MDTFGFALFFLGLCMILSVGGILTLAFIGQRLERLFIDHGWGPYAGPLSVMFSFLIIGLALMAIGGISWILTS